MVTSRSIKFPKQCLNLRCIVFAVIFAGCLFWTYNKTEPEWTTGTNPVVIKYDAGPSEHLQTSNRTLSNANSTNDDTKIEFSDPEELQRYSFLTNPDLAKENDATLLVFVLSSWRKSYRRMLIRKTWANPGNYLNPDGTVSLLTIFAIGLDADGKANDSVLKESASFRDILLLNIKDTYHNLVHKVRMTLEWIVVHSKARYIMKADEDVILNTHAWIAIAQDLASSGASCFVVCSTIKGSGPVRTGKYQVNISEYELGRYPEYCRGPAYLISRDAAMTIVKWCSQVPPLSMEDVFYTGIIPRLTDIHILDIQRFLFKTIRKTNVARIKASLGETLIVHQVRADTWTETWDTMVAAEGRRRLMKWRDVKDTHTVLPSRMTPDVSPDNGCVFKPGSLLFRKTADKN